MRANSIRARGLATVPQYDAGYMAATFPSVKLRFPLASRGGPYIQKHRSPDAALKPKLGGSRIPLRFIQATLLRSSESKPLHKVSEFHRIEKTRHRSIARHTTR